MLWAAGVLLPPLNYAIEERFLNEFHRLTDIFESARFLVARERAFRRLNK
jgi:hypothetical protein